MSSLILITPGTKVTLTGDHLVVHTPPDENQEPPDPQNIPLVAITHIVLTPRVHVTMPALVEVLDRDIPVMLVHSHTHRLVGICRSPPPLSLAARLQLKRSEDPAFVREFAVALITAKMYNQRRVLQRLAANRPEVAAPTLASLETYRERAQQVRPGQLDLLRGLEGAAAQEYFALLAAFFAPHAVMNGRSRQPPRDAPNAVLSYGYTLLYAEALSCLYGVGLDPAGGFLHEPADGRASLALDLIEPYRAPVVDALAVDLFSHKQLDPAKHFNHTDDGCYLNDEGRRKFHLACERRMTRSFKDPQTDEHTTLRTRLHSDATAAKLAITEDRPFTPFRMP
jgi:CRISPR-associated protein Cas1